MNAMRTSNTFDFLKFILEFKNDLVKNDQGAPTQIQEPLKSVHSCMVTGQDIDLSGQTAGPRPVTTRGRGQNVFR